ncbi:MAG TPA: hypothetical protein VN698_11715, partial [Bacteroidia bacterium]|nr:hypothetical protein [Bacteroidia bacterium]
QIGDDGINDGKEYVIKTTEKDFDSHQPIAGISKAQEKETEKFIKNNSGNTEAFKNNSIAYDNSVAIEGKADVRQAMVNEVSKDNGKGGTSNANNREYGGIVDKDETVTTTKPGDVAKPKTDPDASINFQSVTDNTKILFHSHPSGTFVAGGQQQAEPGSYSISTSTTVSHYVQAPSEIDISNIGNKTGYVFGMKSGTVYIYNSSGIQATIPINRFVNPKK